MEVVVLVWKEKDKYIALEPQTLIVSQGKTKQEALNNIREALQLYLEDPDTKPFKPIQQATLETIQI